MFASFDARCVISASVGAALLAHASPSFGGTIPHPGGHASLQAAVDAASAGDTVLVAPGRFVESVVLKKGVSLRSAVGPDSTILVSPGGAAEIQLDRVIHCPPGIDSTTTIEGFTLDHGATYGMGIFCEDSSPVIRGNVVRGFGWGINLRNSHALVERNLIEECRAIPLGLFASSPRILGNELRNNHAVAIEVTGNKSRPVIGGSREHANKIYANPGAIRNGSKRDIEAMWNDWGWETTEEMSRKGYPADIIAITDGNDLARTHRGRGKVDYRNWITAPAAAETRAASNAAAPAAESSPAGAAPATASPRRMSPVVPLAIAALLVAFFVGVARRRRSSSPGESP
jgi:hypothetical protein